MGNNEARFRADSVHMFLALQRTKDGEKARCVRHVIKDNEELDLDIICAKVRCMGGHWRIHKTVNKRDCAKAMNWLQKKLIDTPDAGSYVDSIWRTALLQSECIHGKKRFMLDVDTKEERTLQAIQRLIPFSNIEAKETPNGFHYITEGFDTRDLLPTFKDVVTLHRDGYVYVTSINTTPRRG